jgi:rSAM/selenodomain-associated transferase 1
MKNNNLLIIFMKAPRLGKVKTRLNSHLHPKESLKLYRAIVEDLLDHFRLETEFEVRLYVWPPDGLAEVNSWLKNLWQIIPQSEGDLGDKMNQAFIKSFEEGYDKVIIIGSDLPELTSSDILQGFSELNTVDLILGPSTDGGYYLIGLKKPQPPLFKDISWSTAFVLGQTLEKAQRHGLKINLLEEKTDLDEFDELLNLWHNLNLHWYKNRKSLLPQTKKVLVKLFQ